MFDSIRKHFRVYRKFFVTYLKSRLIYKADFVLGFSSQLINLVFSVAFLTLIFTQVENIQGWSFDELLLLTGFSGLILNTHHLFFFALFRLGQDYILSGRMDRFLVRPLNPLLQLFGNYVAEDNISKILANIALIVYAWQNLAIPITSLKIIYGVLAILSGVMIIGSMFLILGTSAFWTGRSMELFWIFFNISDFRKYPYAIYSMPIQILLVTFFPIAFSSFFPTTFLLGMQQYATMQILSLVVGPIFYLLAYRFWLFGLSKYSSTGS